MRFDEKAPAYEAAAQAQRILADWVAEWLEPDWPRELRALELGAGTGLLSRHLVERGRLHALDASPRMLDQLSAKFPFVRCRLGNAFDLGEGSWDRLYSTAMLQWAPDPHLVFGNWRRSLAPGGRMLHGLFVAPSLSELSSLVPDTAAFDWRAASAWLEAARNSGLQVLRWECRPLVLRHRNAREFLRALHDTGTTPDRPLFGPGRLRQVLRDYDRGFPHPQGGVRASWTLLRFEASAPNDCRK